MSSPFLTAILRRAIGTMHKAGGSRQLDFWAWSTTLARLGPKRSCVEWLARCRSVLWNVGARIISHWTQVGQRLTAHVAAGFVAQLKRRVADA